MDSVSYSLGVMVAQNLKQQNINGVNKSVFTQAFNDMLDEKDLLIETSQASKLINDFFAQEEAKKFGENKKAGEEYLVENAKREEVQVTESGLQYEILNKGDGAIPSLNDKVKVHYHGTLIDGTVFDSSIERGEPISFNLNGVIKGWQEGLQLMPVGSKYKLYIPYELAYGSNPAGPKIQPFSALIFEVTLLGIE
jgi:FKBP-type peptidyl-prolyl cis-trans isomerase FklB